MANACVWRNSDPAKQTTGSGRLTSKTAAANPRRQLRRGAGRRPIDLRRRLRRKERRRAGRDLDIHVEMIAAHQPAAVGRREHPRRGTACHRRQPLQRTLGVGARDGAAARARCDGDDATTPHRRRTRIHRRQGRRALRRARHGVDGSTSAARQAPARSQRLCPPICRHLTKMSKGVSHAAGRDA